MFGNFFLNSLLNAKSQDLVLLIVDLHGTRYKSKPDNYPGQEVLGKRHLQL
jgi:hypothetical protein